MTNLSPKGKTSEKKTISHLAAVIDHSEIANTNLNELFQIPGRCLITRAYAVNEVAGQASLTANLGFKGGTGSELLSAADLDGTPGVVKGDLTTPIWSNTGKTVGVTFSADPTAGRFVFIVEFIEYTLGNGKLVNYAA